MFPAEIVDNTEPNCGGWGDGEALEETSSHVAAIRDILEAGAAGGNDSKGSTKDHDETTSIDLGKG